MIILAVSGVRNPNLGPLLARLVSRLNPDLLALCGDVNVGKHVLRELSLFRLVMISGESDDIYYVKLAKELNALLDGRVVELGDIRVGGMGAVNPLQDVQTLTLRRGSGLDILVSYFPPSGCLDIAAPLYIRTGLKYVNTAVRVLRPRILLVSRSWKSTTSYCEGVPVVGLGRCVAIVKLPDLELRFIPISLAS